MGIRVSNLSFSYGDKVLFDEADFVVEDGQKIGIVGENGTGKSTLLKLFRAEEYPDEGDVIVEGSMEFVPQEVKRDPTLEKAKTVMEYVNPDGHKQEHEICKLFSGLGIGEIDLMSKPQGYSGGVKTKLALSRALFREPDILLLDEPTNFMDLAGKKWVMGLLANYPKTLILISHDLELMDQAIDRIIFVNKHTHKIDEYKGNYSKFLKLQKERETLLKKQVNLQQKQIGKLESAIKVVGVKQRIMLQRRVARLKESLPELPPELRSIKIQLPEPARGGDIPIAARGISKSYGELSVITNLNFVIRRGERIALLGPNGVGKSTLIKLLIGELAPDSGAIEWNPMNKLGYYSQEFENFEMDKTVLELFRDKCERMDSFCRPFLGKFNFLKNKVNQSVGTLSGGEKTRLAIAMLCSTDANILILDEPTTYLDVMSQRVILEALKSYTGTMIVVSHTEEFIKELKPEKVFLMPAAKMEFWREEMGEQVAAI